MKKRVYLSILCASILCANETVTTNTLEVQESVNTKVIENVSTQEIKSADLADALSKNIPSISIVKRNGIANDIILRGQKKDNINILIDDAKIYGACPNRMDPPTSHVLTNNIQSVKVIEGPYDVENFGTLSGLVQVTTKEPTKDVHGEVNINAGSFGYKKASATISGGTDLFKLLISTSTEEGDQYKDGNGNDFLAQQKEKNMSVANQYKNTDQEAFEKKTLLTKAILNINDDSEIRFSYTGNRSDNVLYPAGTMDADYDDSNIYTIGYTARNLADFSKQLDLDYYYSNVDHPMSTKLRNNGSPTYMTAFYKTTAEGAKIKNSMEIADSLVTVGLDTSVRNWKGNMYRTRVSDGFVDNKTTPLASTDTTNKALFAKVEKTFGKLDLEFGTRYDYSDIDSSDSLKEDKKYVGLNANIFAVYNVDESLKYFAGIGKSSRVPDARELYSSTGNSNLNQTKNHEADIGFQKNMGDFSVKTKAFYSELKDYIYNTGTFGNIDATIYGLDVSGTYFATEAFSIDYGMAYQKGKKDRNYADDDLAEIAPLKASLAFNYEMDTSKVTAQIIAVDRWDSYDDSAMEQEIAGYEVLNLKYNQELPKGFDVTIGMDNVLDKTYASTNTYQDITYATVNSERVLFNDMGRYAFVNLRYKF